MFSNKGLCDLISGCNTVAEARDIFESLGYVPPRPGPVGGSFYHPREQRFYQQVESLGGFNNCHGHADRAYTLEEMIRQYGENVFERPMTEKWDMTRALERKTTEDDYLRRILTYIFESSDLGSRYIATNIDADPSAGPRALQAAQIARALFQRNPASDPYGKVEFRFGAHPHEGFYTEGRLDQQKIELYEYGCEIADFCGGLPSRDGRIGGGDEDRFNEHLDIVLNTAKRLGKNCGIHVDQSNSIHENETRRLLEKMDEHRMWGRVVGVHGVSISRKSRKEQDDLFALMKAAGFELIVCATAAISMKAPAEISPTGGSIAPIPDLVKAGVRVSLGGDNRADIYNPNSTGNMREEIVRAQETLRCYDQKLFAGVATNIPFRGHSSPERLFNVVSCG